MNRGIEGEPPGGSSTRLVGLFHELRIIQEPTQAAVDAAIADNLRVMNLEGNHSSHDAAASLIVDNRKGAVFGAVDAAQEYDKIHGSAIEPIVKQRFIDRNPDIALSRRFLLQD